MYKYQLQRMPMKRMRKNHRKIQKKKNHWAKWSQKLAKRSIENQPEMLSDQKRKQKLIQKQKMSSVTQTVCINNLINFNDLENHL